MQLSLFRRTLVWAIVCLLNAAPLLGQPQPEDCVGAIIICSDDIITFNPGDNNLEDFSNPNNDPGCLTTGEVSGLWFYFSFRVDMPLNSEIEFTLTPLGNNNEDYDFAIYGPDLSCDSLGSPIRCSFFDQLCRTRFNTVYRCPETGLGRGATDVSEDKFDEDGFVAPIVVQPGEGFYMYLDNFGVTNSAFQLEWGGSAAPYLNCLANPVCSNKSLDIGEDLMVCAEETVYPFEVQTFNITDNAEFSWSAEPAVALEFLSDTTIMEPVANIPIGFKGPIRYGLTVIDEGCQKIDYITLLVNRPNVEIEGKSPFCFGEPNILTAPEGFVSYRWSTGDTTSVIEVYDPDLYILDIVDSLGCEARGSILVEQFMPRPFGVDGPNFVCLDQPATLIATDGFEQYIWSTGDTLREISVVGAGTYSVTATDENGCTTYIASHTFEERPPPEPTFSGDASFCTGQSGTITAQGGFVSYHWSPGNETRRSISVTEGGIYTVTVEDANGCEGSADYEIIETELPTPIINGTFNICTGTPTVLDVGSGFNDVLWSTNETTDAITVTQGGIITVFVTDTLGCQGFDTVRVTENAKPLILEEGAGFCPGESVTLDPGEFESYLWSDGSTDPTLTVSTTQTVGLTVVDENGCETMGSVEVKAFETPIFSLSNDTSFCQNDSTEMRVLEDFPTYSWSNGASEQGVFFDQAGNYTVSVIDTNGCRAEKDFTMRMDTLPLVDIGGDPSICINGIATINVPPGYANYLWSTGENTREINIDTAGAFGVTITDSNGCVGQDSLVVTENPLPDPRFSGNLGICPGDTTTIKVVGTFSKYLWSNGDTLAETKFSTIGPHFVTVTDNLGCQGVDSIELGTFDAPELKILGKDAFCDGYTTILQANSEFSSYKWSTEDTKRLIVINEEGTYQLTVTDRNGCEATDSMFVKVNPRPDLNILGDPQFCEGEQTELDAGPGFVDYIWSTGNRTQSQTVTEPGYYSLVVRDTNNCLIAKGLNVVENPNPEPGVTGDTTFCAGEQTILTAEPGFEAYLWSDSVTTQSDTIRRGGDITLTVRDNNQCEGDTTITIIEHARPDLGLSGPLGFCPGDSTVISVADGFVNVLWSTGDTTNSVIFDTTNTFSVTVTDNLGCQATETGQIQAFELPVVALNAEMKICPDIVAAIDGGEGFAGYIWSNGSRDRFLMTDSTGIYSLTVTDNNGCMSSGETTLTPYEKPNVQLPEDRVFCPGENISVVADPGFISYTWSDPDSTQGRTLVTDTPGNYILTVRDSNDCVATDDINLMSFPTKTPKINGVDSVCIDENSILSVEQEFESYLWSTGDTTSQIRISGGGSFSVMVFDTNGCRTDTLKEVFVFPEPDFEFTGDRALCDGVSAKVGVSPGFDSYRWSVDGRSQDSSVVITLPGLYFLTVTDENGCSASDSILLDEMPSPTADGGEDQTFPCVPGATIQIGGEGTSENGPYKYMWVGPGIDSSNRNMRRPWVEAPGDYFMIVIDTLSRCRSDIEQVKVISEISDADIQLLVGDNVDCKTQLVEIDASRSMDIDSLSFQWLNSDQEVIPGETKLNVWVGSSGWYYLESKLPDTRCSRLDSIEVRKDFLVPIVFAGRDKTLTCERPVLTLDGSASTEGIGLEYEWRKNDGINEGFSNDRVVENINQPGQFIFKVTNLNNGCFREDTISIGLDKGLPRAILPGDQVLDCIASTVVLDGSASTSGADIKYGWFADNGVNLFNEKGQQITVNVGGQYALVVTNESNGCADTTFVQVADNIDQLEPAIRFGAPRCFGDSDGFIVIDSVSGGMGPYSYSLNNGSFDLRNNYQNLPGGTYTLLIEDVGGCQATRTIDLGKGNFIDIDLGPDQEIYYGDRVQVTVDIQSGKPLDRFSWLEPGKFVEEDSRIFNDSLTQDTWFIAEAVDVDGCTTIDSAFVKVLSDGEVYIPNIFRPGGNGNNRKFTIFGNFFVEKVNSLMIFDRWGDKVFLAEDFEPNDVEAGWDGTSQEDGDEYNIGVFVYVAEVTFKDGTVKQYSGDVTLIR